MTRKQMILGRVIAVVLGWATGLAIYQSHVLDWEVLQGGVSWLPFVALMAAWLWASSPRRGGAK